MASGMVSTLSSVSSIMVECKTAWAALGCVSIIFFAAVCAVYRSLGLTASRKGVQEFDTRGQADWVILATEFCGTGGFLLVDVLGETSP